MIKFNSSYKKPTETAHPGQDIPVNPDLGHRRRGGAGRMILSVLFIVFLAAIHLLFNRSSLIQHDHGLEGIVIASLVLAFATILVLLHDRSWQRRQSQPRHQLLLQSILDNTTSLIFIKDLSGRYILANHRFMEFLGVREAAVIGHTDHDFDTPELAAHYQALDHAVIREGRSIEVEELVHTPAGDRNLLLIKFPLLDAAKNIFGIGGIATDITDRTHYQKELIRARNEAEETRQLQEQFLANMSHEIRTPMNGIQGMTNLLLDTPLNPQQHEFAEIIRRSMQNLLVIVNDILDFSKIKAGKLALEKIDFTLRDVLDNIEGVMGQRIRKKGLGFHIDLDPSIPPVLRGDPYRLNQVLLNLIGNAMKFTENGHIHVGVTQQSHTDSGTTILFKVSDTGSGISAENLPLIFDSFSQAGLDITRRHGGTGLGLAICNQLLRLQQGGITVHSLPDQGATFEFWLPYEKGIDSPGKKTGGNPLDHSSALRGKRFLVAEDNEINQKLIEFVLKKGGGDVTIASNGQQAIEILKSASATGASQNDAIPQAGSPLPPAPFDILIMDLQMPLMDGYQATKYIREEMQNPIPIIAMTATALKGEHLRCLETGMNDYMTKPFEFADLYKCIAVQLGRQALNGPSLPAHRTRSASIGTDGPDRLYDLSLLMEMEDNEYLLEMLDSFLTNAPVQLKEIQHAADISDTETVYHLSHKLKGSASMFRALALQEMLAAIESRARDRQPTADFIAEATRSYQDLEKQLLQEKENVQHTIQYENSNSRG